MNSSLLVFLCGVIFVGCWIVSIQAHSEQFHKFPMHPRNFKWNKPSQYDRILAALKKNQNVKGRGAESHLGNVHNITGTGTNAEAYWSFDGKHFSFQAIFGHEGDIHPCDQIYTMNTDGSNKTLISTGRGRDTCSYYLPDGESVIYSSTQSGGPWCPATPDMAYGYLWPIYTDMHVYRYFLQTHQLIQLTHEVGYDAESTIAPDGSKIIFTSSRSGDLELYTMNFDGSDVRRLTYTPGYDGGAYFSYDSKMICWRANRPVGEDLTNYLNFIHLGLVEPTNMQIYVAAADGSNPIQVTNTSEGLVNFSPFFLPDDSGVIFSSNMNSTDGMEFQLYMIKLDGSGLEQITFDGTFNSFPMFSPDGKYLAWESNRDTQSYSDLNVYIATWIQ